MFYFFLSEIKLAISSVLESGKKTNGASSGAGHGDIKKVAALVVSATCSGASHSSDCVKVYNYFI